MVEGYVKFTLSREEIVQGLREIINTMPRKTVEFVDDIGDTAKYLMSDEAPVKWGDLQDSHVIEIAGLYDRWIYPEAPHAIFVIGGTQAHEILPRGVMYDPLTGRYRIASDRKESVYGMDVDRGARALWWPGAAHPVPRVWHPGTLPNPYPDRAMERLEDLLNVLCAGYLDDVVGDW